MNIFEDYHACRDNILKGALESVEKSKNSFFYSPAHMEELAVILRTEQDEDIAIKYIWAKLNTISEMTNNLEFLPSHSSIIIKEEHPSICFKRVIENYDATLFAEENEEYIFSLKNSNSLKKYFKDDNIQGLETFDMIQERFGIDKRELNTIPPEELFSTKKVLEAFDSLMIDFGYSFESLLKWDDIKNKHSHIEATIGLLYNFLEKIGYKAEKQNKLRSRMHDVSHGIYATASDMLITGDDRFYKKTKAIYCLLEIPTIVYNKNEFTTYASQTVE